MYSLHHLIAGNFLNEFYHFVQFLGFIFCLITLICDTNVKYFNTPVFEGVQKCFYFMCKVSRTNVNLYFY